MPLWYWLVDGKPVPVDNFNPEFAAWWGDFQHHRDVAQTTIPNPAGGEVRVSTVFLALDHSWGDGPPILWETMVFGLPDDEPCWRYASVEEAWAGHEHAIVYAKERLAGQSREKADEGAEDDDA